MSAWDLVVVGGGAAGIFGAIAAAEAFAEQGVEGRVLVLEQGRDLLGKVKISGGGRCNVTHDCHEPRALATHYPRGQRSLIGGFSRFGPAQTIAWFAERGVELKVEADGRMFPTTDSSQTVIDTLITAAEKAGVVLRTRAKVTAVKSIDTKFIVDVAGELLDAESVLLATGGMRGKDGGRLAEMLGHSVPSTVPSLFTFKVRDKRLDELSGLSVSNVEARVVGEKSLAAAGPLLVTHWGVSGPGILKLSAWGAEVLAARDYRFTLRIDWLPGVDVPGQMRHLRSERARQKVVTRSGFDVLPKRLWARLCAAALIDDETTWSQLRKEQEQALVRELTEGEYPVDGKSLNKDEFVTCGGIELKEVDLKSMESKRCEGLFFAGEILHVDGVTGGFNFQNAWTTGWHAGRAIALRGASL